MNSTEGKSHGIKAQPKGWKRKVSSVTDRFTSKIQTDFLALTLFYCEYSISIQYLQHLYLLAEHAKFSINFPYLDREKSWRSSEILILVYKKEDDQSGYLDNEWT